MSKTKKPFMLVMELQTTLNLLERTHRRLAEDTTPFINPALGLDLIVNHPFFAGDPEVRILGYGKEQM